MATFKKKHDFESLKCRRNLATSTLEREEGTVIDKQSSEWKRMKPNQIGPSEQLVRKLYYATLQIRLMQPQDNLGYKPPCLGRTSPVFLILLVLIVCL